MSTLIAYTHKMGTSSFFLHSINIRLQCHVTYMYLHVHVQMVQIIQSLANYVFCMFMYMGNTIS